MFLHYWIVFDDKFSQLVEEGDIIICGENFGCGSSREHPSVGFVYTGIKAVIVKSVSRIFYRSAINQGLPILVIPEAVNAYKQGAHVKVDLEHNKIVVDKKEFKFQALPAKLKEILVRWLSPQIE